MIYFYNDILPNYEENTHYVFSDFADYVTELGTPALSVIESNYSINEGYIRVKFDAAVNADRFTYVRVETGTRIRFYFVRSLEYRSGFWYFNVELDLWGSFFPNAQISHIHASRCSRNIGNGVYDPIAVTEGRYFQRLGEAMDEKKFSIVAVMVFATGVSSIFFNASGTAIGLFVEDLQSVTTKPITSTIDFAIEMISSVYAAHATVGDVDASCIKAYIVPTEWVTGSKEPGVPVFKSKSRSFGNLDWTPDWEAAPFIYTKSFTVEIDPNKKYFVGTKLSGLEITRTTQTTTITLTCAVKQDGIQVLIQQGDRMLDITEAFQFGLTNNDGNVTASQQIAKTLQTVGMITSGVAQISTGVGALSGALTIGNAINNSITEGNARYTQGGDALCFMRTLGGGMQTPFFIQTNNSINNEAMHARIFGASFDEDFEDISNIFDYDLFGAGDDKDDTYFAADVRVEGVPLDARDAITTTLRNGVYLRQI